jgi:hypothetical protein
MHAAQPAGMEPGERGAGGVPSRVAAEEQHHAGRAAPVNNESPVLDAVALAGAVLLVAAS